ncbi:MAG: FAD-binding oxidoreductase, partial [Candidatus Korobacteraceae bacterium]
PTAEQALDALRPILVEGTLRRGNAAGEVLGVVPELYIEPANEAELSRALDYARQAGLLVSPRGGGTKLEWGTAPRAIDLAISTARFNRILEYAPDDMTVTVGAGVTIAQLQSALTAHGQRLALDPLCPQRATAGGTIATNDSGALRLRYGSIRDLILGITVVLPDGTIATSGGKVVKNVAGYDLPKLMSGALGTLGIITRAVFRLHPLPQQSQSLTFAFPDCESANRFLLAVADSQVVPTGLQMRTGADGTAVVDIRIDGIAAGISAQTDAVSKLAGSVNPSAPDGDPWQAREQLCSAASPLACIVKLSMLPAQLSSTAAFVRQALDQTASWTLLLNSTGLAWLRVDTADSAPMADFLASLRAFLAPTGGTAVLLHASPALRQKVDVWGDIGNALPLMRRLKEQFDPQAILNRGRFVGGI